MSAAGTITIRDVVAEDAEPCAAIVNEWYDSEDWITRDDDDTPEKILAEFQKSWPRPRAFIAERDGEVLGYMALGHNNGERVGGLFIGAAHRRSGAGTALMNYAKSLHPEGLTLWTAEANTPARAFYRRHGFETLTYDPPDTDDHPGGGDFQLKWPGIRSAPIETERLILRRPRADDAKAGAAFFASDRARHIGQEPTPWKAWSRFAAELGHWEVQGWGSFAVTRKGSDKILGLVGAWGPEGWPENELCWLIFEGAEGQGIGFEAASAARDYVFGTLGWETAVSYIDPQNQRSITLAERLGAVRDDRAKRPSPDDLVYRHPRPGGLAA